MMNAESSPPVLAVGAEPPALRTPKRDIKSADRPTKNKATAGRFQTINAFLDVTLRRLSRAEGNVWLLLWRDTKPNGLAQTGQADLARRAGVDSRTVRRALRRLAALGLLKVVRRGGLRQGTAIYRLFPLEKLLS